MQMGDGNDGTARSTHECADCGARFNDNWHLQHHQMTHAAQQQPKPAPPTGLKVEIGVGNDSSTCCSQECSDRGGARFNENWNLQQHLYNAHNTGGGQATKPTAKPKMEIGVCENGGKRRPHECEHCGSRFTDNWHLKRHQITHTGGSQHKLCEKRYQCPDCGAWFGDNWHLQRHQFTHTGGACEYCGKRFSQLDRLKTHRRVHTGEKPYSCKLCSYQGRTNEHLKRHMGRKHNDVQPYFCEDCQKSFMRKDHLSLHIKFTHSPDQKPAV